MYITVTIPTRKNDDDGLYETFVDENEEFVGVRVTAEEKVEFDGNGDEIVLSDDDSKYGSKNSYYTSSDEENSHKRKHHFKNFRPEKFVLGVSLLGVLFNKDFSLFYR